MTKVVPSEEVPETDHRPRNRFYKFCDRHLVGKSDAGNYSQKWREDFSHHPTWCDADMSLQQINRGMAKGNRFALYARTLFQSLLFKLGRIIQLHPWKTLIIGLLTFLVCSIGLKDAVIETDIVKLWVSQGGRLDEELHYLSRVTSEVQSGARSKRDTPFFDSNRTSEEAHRITKRGGPELPRENGLGGGFQVVIQTPEHKGENILTTEGLLKHVDIMKEIAQYKVEMYGENWTLSDICFKPPSPKFGEGPLAGIMSTLLDKIIPCIWITPIDCFWEGSKPLGPYPALNLGADISGIISSLPKGNITWKNLNPTEVLKEVGVLFDLGTIGDFFDRAGIGAAYLDRPCIDPLDPECPRTAPNGFDKCGTYRRFRAWNKARPASEQVYLDAEHRPTDDGNSESDAGSFIVDLLGRRKKRQAALSPVTNSTSAPKKQTKDEDYYSYEDDNDYEASLKHNGSSSHGKKVVDPIEAECQIYGNSMLRWMRTYPERWGEFLTQDEMPKFPNYGEIMTGGCKGFGKKIMKWPEDLIIGGVTRQNQRVAAAEAFQSVFLVAGGFDVYLRFKDAKPDLKPHLNVKTWTPGKAHEVVQAWQRNFTKKLYEHRWNHEKEGVRVVHPLASTSIADMLEEFSQFKFFVIIMGYFLMVLYAGWSQLEWDGWWFSPTSTCGLSFIGVFLVTYSSIAGLGLSTFFGINFNAATTQIVPFLTLGLGVDDMFLFLHTYGEVLHVTKDNELGVLMKETGMSILITSTNNVLAFISGTVLPIPALRSFCSQSAILLAFNLFGIMFIYPAFIALDLRRRKSGVRDMLCCCPTCDDEDADEKKLRQAQEESLRENGIMKNGMRGAGLPAIEYPAPPPPVDFVDNGHSEQLHWYTLDGFVNLYYIPFLQMPSTKVMVLLLCSAMFLFGCYGLHESTIGLELSDVLPEGTAPSAFLKAREQYFSFYPMFGTLKGREVDYPKQQMQIEEYRQAIAKSPFVIKVDGKPSEHYWLSLMRLWLTSLQTHLDEAIAKGQINNVTGEINKGVKLKDEAGIARRLLCSYGTTYNCTGRVGHIRLIEPNGMINQEGFYNYLTGWYNVDNMMYYVSQAAFYPSPPGWAYTKQEKLVPAAPPLAYSQIPFYLTDLINTPVIVDMIREVRGTCERFEAEGLPNFPQGIAFTFWEQYLDLSWNLFLAICIIAGCVFLVVSSIIFNPWAAAMVMIVVVSMTIELAGFMGLFGVKLNPVSAVTLITAVGIGVEFTAHVVLAFLTSLGTRDERMASCMNHMFTPVVHGGLSTLLGIVMLAFSEFEFVVTYFFLVMSVLILLGLINGLALLPVLLSLIGPPCELTPLNGSKTLQAPPPLNKDKRNETKTESEIALVSGTMISIRRPAGIEKNASDSSLRDSAGSSSDSQHNEN
uniref:SSD domain-containing protein n=1 Tax=Steinernema glaseri TaxID=37863 RepID=A0A1I7Z3V5_9BILA